MTTSLYRNKKIYIFLFLIIFTHTSNAGFIEDNRNVMEALKKKNEDMVNIIKKEGDKIPDRYVQADKQDDGKLKFWLKPDKSKQTQIDIDTSNSIKKAFNKLLADRPLENFKNEVLIHSEEDDPVPLDQRKNYKIIVLIDPIDGTNALIDGKLHQVQVLITVLVADTEDRAIPVFSVVHRVMPPEGMVQTVFGGTLLGGAYYYKKGDDTLYTIKPVSYYPSGPLVIVRPFGRPKPSEQPRESKFYVATSKWESFTALEEGLKFPFTTFFESAPISSMLYQSPLYLPLYHRLAFMSGIPTCEYTSAEEDIEYEKTIHRDITEITSKPPENNLCFFHIAAAEAKNLRAHDRGQEEWDASFIGILLALNYVMLNPNYTPYYFNLNMHTKLTDFIVIHKDCPLPDMDEARAR